MRFILFYFLSLSTNAALAPLGKLLIGGWNFLLGVTRVLLLLLLLRTRRRRRRRRRRGAFRSFGALTKFFSLHYRFHHVWVRRILREARVVSALYFFIIFLSFPLAFSLMFVSFVFRVTTLRRKAAAY